MGFSQLNHSFIEANKTWDEFFVTDVSAYGKQLFNYKNQIYLAYTQTQILIFVVKFMKNERK